MLLRHEKPQDLDSSSHSSPVRYWLSKGPFRGFPSFSQCSFRSLSLCFDAKGVQLISGGSLRFPLQTVYMPFIPIERGSVNVAVREIKNVYQYKKMSAISSAVFAENRRLRAFASPRAFPFFYSIETESVSIL